MRFEVADTEEATGGLAEPAPIKTRALSPDSLLPEDTEWEAILPQKLIKERGAVKAILVDPDYEGEEPLIRTFSLSANGEADTFKFRAAKLGERMFLLVLHKDGSEVSSVVVKTGSREALASLV